MIDYMDLEKFVAWLKTKGISVRIDEADRNVTSSDIRALAIEFNKRPAQGYEADKS